MWWGNAFPDGQHDLAVPLQAGGRPPPPANAPILYNPPCGFAHLVSAGDRARRSPARSRWSWHSRYGVGVASFKPAAPGRNARAALTLLFVPALQVRPGSAGGPAGRSSPPTPFRGGVVLKESVVNAVTETAAAEPVSGVEISCRWPSSKKSRAMPARCRMGKPLSRRWPLRSSTRADPEYCRRAGSQGGRDADWQLSRHRWRRPQAGDAAARQKRSSRPQ